MLYKTKEFYYSPVIQDNAHDTRLLFRSIDKLLQRQTEKHYPSADNDQQLAIVLAEFLYCQDRKDSWRAGTSEKWTCSLPWSGQAHLPVTVKWVWFGHWWGRLETDQKFHYQDFKLDPLPATIIRSCYSALVPVFKTVINLSLSNGAIPADLTIASLRSLLKKPNADCEQFSNFRPVSNLKFLSKLVEKSVFAQMNNYLTVNGLHERSQSAYKEETALLTHKWHLTFTGQEGQCVPIVTISMLMILSSTYRSKIVMSMLQGCSSRTVSLIYVIGWT